MITKNAQALGGQMITKNASSQLENPGGQKPVQEGGQNPAQEGGQNPAGKQESSKKNTQKIDRFCGRRASDIPTAPGQPTGDFLKLSVQQNRDPIPGTYGKNTQNARESWGEKL